MAFGPWSLQDYPRRTKSKVFGYERGVTYSTSFQFSSPVERDRFARNSARQSCTVGVVLEQPTELNPIEIMRDMGRTQMLYSAYSGCSVIGSALGLQTSAMKNMANGPVS